MGICWLVVFLEHNWMIFFQKQLGMMNHPNGRTHIFQRGIAIPPTREDCDSWLNEWISADVIKHVGFFQTRTRWTCQWENHWKPSNQMGNCHCHVWVPEGFLHAHSLRTALDSTGSRRFNGNFSILKWGTLPCKAIFCGDILLHRPKI